MTSLSERLKNDEIILLDGAVSTEIQKRGVAMDSDVWSGVAHKTHPEVVRQVHEDYMYLNVGSPLGIKRIPGAQSVTFFC